MGEDNKKDEFISYLNDKNSPASKELIEVLIKNTQQSTEQSTMVRTTLLEMKNKLDNVDLEVSTLSDKYNKLMISLEGCPVKKDELALQKLRVDMENIKLNLTEVKRDTSNFIEVVDDNIIAHYAQEGGVKGFFSKFLKRNIFYIFLAILIMHIIQNIVLYINLGG
jgi:hypothetical protein